MILPLLSLGLFLLGQVGRLTFNQQEINIYLYEIPYFIWLILLIVKQGRSNKVTKPSIILLGVLAITFIIGILRVSVYDNVVSFLYLLRLSLYIVGFSLMIEHFTKKAIAPQYLKIFLTLMSVVGIVQYFFYSNLRNLQYLGWDPHQSRVFGLFLDTSVAGAVYGLLLLFTLSNSNFFRSRFVRWIYVICYMFLGLFTYSRGFLVSMLASALTYSSVIKKNLKIILATTVLLTMFAIFSPKPFGEGVNLLRTSTIDSRLVDYNQGFELWKKNPVIGIGYNRIRYYKPVMSEELRGRSHAGASFHSSFLVILVTAGVVGLGTFVYWLWAVSKISNFALISTVFLGVYSLFDNILLHPFILFLWPVLIGVTSRRKQ